MPCSPGTTFASSNSADAIAMPSTRIGNAIRRQAFSLPPTQPRPPSKDALSSRTPTTASSTVSTASRSTAATVLRKSYRKTMKAVSSIKVRMRNCFVPHVFLPRDSAEGDTLDDDERLSVGGEERSIIL